MIEARKISFQEAWDSSIVFFVDEELEQEIESQVESLLKTARDQNSSESSLPNMVNFLVQQNDGLDVILKDLELSQEKFMRIVSLLRKLGRIPGGFDIEWGMQKIKRKIQTDPAFAIKIAELLLDGKRDEELKNYIPRYYLDTLNYREAPVGSEASLKKLYKRQLIGTYGARKGHKVEDRIQQQLMSIEVAHGVGYAKGRSRIIETDIDFAIPNLDDPWVILMSSFQETTSSGQSTKARDMLSAYERVLRNNSRYGEKRVFVNFVDGGGWLARKRDFQRLVQQCDYFINFHYLDMLEAIVLKHVPRKYFQRNKCH
ncbi:MAG: hypothetical protein ONB31_06980 [candidate division KSB1 bacterium]|nr:hypothetical protein [candidate division KSB1 bacterium]MDZ7335973.1 hypothetical protein [candidate division KSB1 bacterium]MDZ7357939.1 hypothetical protein [candidate division KSB1 bacterium]